jgi:large subunit ribosomal protein L23
VTDYDPRNLADLILKPIVTEKATLLLEDNKYVFEVALKSNKSQIKAAIESLFKVSVLKVNTARPPRKKKRVGKFVGYKPLYKRATVTLQEGDSIVLFPEV